MEFNYCLNPDDEKPFLLINTHIGIFKKEDGTEVKGVIGDEFVRELAELERSGKKAVEIWFNTGGGSVKDGWDIYGYLQLTKMHITGLNIGIAASTGGWLFEGCHERIMMDYALLMMHNPHGGGNEGQAEFTDSIATMLCAKAKKSKEEVLALMAATTFMNAEKALENGFCDEVRPSGTTLTNETPNLDFIWNKGNEFLNSILPVKHNKMKGIITLLNSMAPATAAKLSDTADEAAIQAFFTKLKNDWAEDKTKLEGERDEFKKKMDEMTDEAEDSTNSDAYNELKNKYDALNKAVDKLKEDRENEMNARNEEDCKNAVNAAVELGQIVNTAEAIGFWTSTGKTVGVKTLKNMLDTMPVNRSMPFPTPNDVEKGDRSTDAPAVDVAEFKNQFKGEFK